APSERLAWSGSAQSRGFAVAAAVLGVGALAAVLLAPALAAALSLSALAAVEFISVHVTVGANGVRVAPPTRFPRVTIPLADIDSAAAVDVRPMARGGWG